MRYQERLLSCLADLNQQSTVLKLDDGKMRKIVGVASDGRLWVARVVESIGRLKNDSKHVKSTFDLDENATSLLRRAENVLASLRSSSGDESRQGAELLLCTSILLQHIEGADTSTLEVRSSLLRSPLS
jgi:DNA polymerase phi